MEDDVDSGSAEDPEDGPGASLARPANPDVEEALTAASYDPLGLVSGAADDAGQDASAATVGRAKLTEAELTLILIDLISAHKLTDSSAVDIWNVIRMLLPPEVDVKTFTQVKYILNQHHDRTRVLIDVCANDCIAYWDSTFLPDPIRHAHRSKCPICNLSRYVEDPRDGGLRARKVREFALT